MNVKESVDRWLAAGDKVAVITVIETSGSSPRGAGSIMAVSTSGGVVGSVSAGCVEGAVFQEALEVAESDCPRLLRFREHPDEEWDVTLPCGGEIEVLVQPYDDEVHELLFRLMAKGDGFTNIIVTEQSHPMFGSQAVIGADEQAFAWMDQSFLEEALSALDQASGPNCAFTQTIMGARSLLVRQQDVFTLVCIGAVHIAETLVPLARALGYRTVVVDPRSAFLQPERFPDADRLMACWPQEALAELAPDQHFALCALTHDEKIDSPALASALATDAFYIGCLGSFKTLSKRKDYLEGEGFEAADLERIWGPIGLYIGGSNPEEIALSVLAQIQAVRYGRIGHGDAMPGHTLANIPQPQK